MVRPRPDFGTAVAVIHRNETPLALHVLAEAHMAVALRMDATTMAPGHGLLSRPAL